MKILRFSAFILYTLYSLLYTHLPPVHAVSVDPIPPFSLEGNPPEDYYFGAIFPLFRYISPPKLEIYENMDRSRSYEPYKVCGGGGDRRDYVCAVDAQTGEEIDGCDGGDVDICYKDEERNGQLAYTTHSNPNNSCSAKPNPDLEGIIKGKCDYTQNPSVHKDVKGTDFSTGELIFPKLQSEMNAYSYVGTDNAITWGSHQLMMSQGQKILNQLMVVKRAKLTKATVNQTGEWPLGWVDWGYKDKNMTKTLIEIHDELPGGLSGAAGALVEAHDDFFLNAGNLGAVSDVSNVQVNAIETVSLAASLNPQPEWVKDLLSVPLYGPSWRQGYTRPSICVWDLCCPGIRCPIEPIGIKRGLYYDASISQTFGAALDSLLLNYSLEEGSKIFRQLAIANPLIRFATGTMPNAIPSEIHRRLDAELSDKCRQYVPWSNFLSFGTHIDYLDPGNFLGPDGTCPDYRLAPELNKENAGAFVQSPLSALINLIWGQREDEVDPIKYHFLTIPDALGQSIQELQQPVYDTRDSLSYLDTTKGFNEELSNTVEEGQDNLYGGKSLGPGDARRRLTYYTCDDDMFSAQTSTSIEAYALGTRIGCYDTTEVPEGKCDGKLFGELIAGSKYENSSAKGTQYFDSFIKGNLTPELMNTYAAAESVTGVPCEILAGIHFVEAGNNPSGSLVSGRKLGTPEPDAGGKVFRSLLETAKYAGDHLTGKVGGTIADAETAITALSRYNGGGNSNCQLGYPYPIPYAECPRAFEGEDDPYPTSFIDSKHDSMYLLYCADHTACAPQIFERPGSFTVALNVYNSITKSGYENTALPPNQLNPAPAPTVGRDGTSLPTGFFPKNCGPQSLSTALGCLPYTREAFVSTLLSFIVGIAGAIALVTMLIATVQIMTAASDAKKLQSGRDLFFSAVAGLLFLIFSVSLLRIIAGDIIKLPGFK